jgi:hypothetical protein
MIDKKAKMARIIIMIDKRQIAKPSCTFSLVEPNFEPLIIGVRRPTTVEVEDRD